MDDQGPDVVTVEILGQRYPIRSALDTGYVSELARYVDEKMRTASTRSTGDSVRVAVLAALNIADEYFRCRDTGESATGEVRKLTLELERIVDDALTTADDAAPAAPSSGGPGDPAGSAVIE